MLLQTPSTPNLHCFVGKNFLLQNYTLFSVSKCGNIKSDKYGFDQCHQIRLSFSHTFCNKDGIDAVTGHLLFHLVQICLDIAYFFLLKIEIYVNTKYNFGWFCWIKFSFLFSLWSPWTFHIVKTAHSYWFLLKVIFTFQLPRSKSSICNPSCWPLHICENVCKSESLTNIMKLGRLEFLCCCSHCYGCWSYTENIQSQSIMWKLTWTQPFWSDPQRSSISGSLSSCEWNMTQSYLFFSNSSITLAVNMKMEIVNN